MYLLGNAEVLSGKSPNISLARDLGMIKISTGHCAVWRRVVFEAIILQRR